MLSLLKSRRAWMVTIVACVGLLLVMHVWPEPDLADSWFQLGQGSGLLGLNVVKIGPDGRVCFEYKTRTGWARRRFSIDADTVQMLKDKIKELGILDLNRIYTADIVDGAQWCLLIKGDGPPKAIYCNNNFPKPVVELAEYVHKTIIEPNAGKVAETAVPKWNHRKHERELWDSISNKK